MLSLTRLSTPCITYLNTWTRLHILIHCRLVSALGKNRVSSANQNRTWKKPINFVSQSESSITSPDSSANQNRVLRHPIRQPIRIEYYVTRVVIKSPESSRLGWKTLLGSRLESARYSLS